VSPRSGGDVIAIEVTRMDGKEDFILTGQLGEVMRESRAAGLSWIRTHAAELGIPRETFEKQTLHIHVPAGAIRRTGPSAGITMATAMVSAFTGIPIRRDLVMTGESPFEAVLPIGGLKEQDPSQRISRDADRRDPAQEREGPRNPRGDRASRSRSSSPTR